MSEHTADSYKDKAARYAEGIDKKPLSIYFERPAFVSLVSDLSQKTVLDAGCGSGWLSEYLLAQGAAVTAVDFNEEFVRLTQERLNHKVKVLQANLAEPLDFAKDASFDLITCSLVMHYLKDWLATFQEFHRVLKKTGVLVFSTHHPFSDWQEFQTDSYFATDLLEDEWDVGKVRFYRRPLSKMSEDLAKAGFVIERILEPEPQEALKTIDPELYARLSRKPWRLMIRACKQSA